MERLTNAAAGFDRPSVAAELVERCKRGDDTAWRELVEETHREVYALCYRILRNPHEATEATQDAYVKAWRGLAGFRGDAQFTTWLYRIASNAAISRQRTRSRRQKRETADVVLSDLQAPGSVEASAAIRLDVDLLEAAVASLPDEYRVPLLLRDVYGFPIVDVAKQVGISETAAKVRVHRARKKVRELLVSAQEDQEE